MKNIAIDVRCLMEEKITGVGEYTFNLLKEIFKQDRQNRYFLFFNKQNPYKKFINLLKTPSNTLCEFNIPNRLLNLSIKFFDRPFLDSLIHAKYKSKIDLFFFPNLNFFSVSSFCKTIITGHDLSYELFPDFYDFKRRLWHRLIDSQGAFLRSDKIVAVSENTKQDLINVFNVNPNKITVVHSGIKIEAPATVDQRVIEKYHLPEKYILTLSTLEPRKNIETLIEAYDLLRKNANVPQALVIAGPAGWKHDPILAGAKKSKNHQDIIFCDYVSVADKPHIYKQADLFVFPSYYEGFGFPPLEAMACKTPVIASNNSSLTEICENAAILIDPYNVHEIYMAMNEILTDTQLRASLVGKGYVHAQKFRWEDSAKAMVALFNQ
ncbi:MAG: glycosyltransferase family 4 protein [Patescibacteria group bacterium]